ncbi:hypothetical protein B0H63DRAFT_449283 [Podospora didyma]|uniref:Protein kinase domain-containing protein n=1 Tax=Podospora didyma TaxID=330526 RepID=A0AAE0TZH1_9PEZI|nr:hypothetical protein B0H63DRAFT_449283 [Podospora didyma]
MENINPLDILLAEDQQQQQSEEIQQQQSETQQSESTRPKFNNGRAKALAAAAPKPPSKDLKKYGYLFNEKVLVVKKRKPAEKKSAEKKPAEETPAETEETTTTGSKSKAEPDQGGSSSSSKSVAPAPAPVPVVSKNPLGRQFLFVRNIDSGLFSTAQLVMDTKTDELFVRKVKTKRSRIDPKYADLDAEIEAMEYLQHPENLRDASPRPWLPELLSHELIPMAKVRSDDSSHPGPQTVYAQVSYWKYLNGGSLKDVWGCDMQPIAKFPAPFAVIARYTWQVLSTMQYMYHRVHQGYVMHTDMHEGNIWLHWDETEDLPNFHVGDFGNSIFVPPYDDSDSSPEKGENSPGSEQVEEDEEDEDEDEDGKEADRDIDDVIKAITHLLKNAAGYREFEIPIILQLLNKETPAPVRVFDRSDIDIVTRLTAKHERCEIDARLMVMHSILKKLERLRAEQRVRRRDKRNIPVDLMEVIHLAKSLELDCTDGSGSSLDETNTADYIRVSQYGRERVSMASGHLAPRPFTFAAASVEDALKPTFVVTYDHDRTRGPHQVDEPLQILGPWYLVSIPSLVLADPNPHHRPAALRRQMWRFQAAELPAPSTTEIPGAFDSDSSGSPAIRSIDRFIKSARAAKAKEKRSTAVATTSAAATTSGDPSTSDDPGTSDDSSTSDEPSTSDDPTTKRPAKVRKIVTFAEPEPEQPPKTFDEFKLRGGRVKKSPFFWLSPARDAFARIRRPLTPTTLFKRTPPSKPSVVAKIKKTLHISQTGINFRALSGLDKNGSKATKNIDIEDIFKPLPLSYATTRLPPSRKIGELKVYESKLLPPPATAAAGRSAEDESDDDLSDIEEPLEHLKWRNKLPFRRAVEWYESGAFEQDFATLVAQREQIPHLPASKHTAELKILFESVDPNSDEGGSDDDNEEKEEEEEAVVEDPTEEEMVIPETVLPKKNPSLVAYRKNLIRNVLEYQVERVGEDAVVLVAGHGAVISSGTTDSLASSPLIAVRSERASRLPRMSARHAVAMDGGSAMAKTAQVALRYRESWRITFHRGVGGRLPVRILPASALPGVMRVARAAQLLLFANFLSAKVFFDLPCWAMDVLITIVGSRHECAFQCREVASDHVQMT